MSFDVTLQLVDDYHDQGFPRSIVEQVFSPFLGADGRLLSFPDGAGGDLYVADKPMISGFGVTRAVGLALYRPFTKLCVASGGHISIGLAVSWLPTLQPFRCYPRASKSAQRAHDRP